MKISILTIFPEMFHDFMKEPVIARAIEKEAVRLELVDIRLFAGGSFRHIDDDSYGGGAGMVMRCGPVLDALETVRTPGSYTAVLTPAGRRYTQKQAHAFAKMEHLILICGHYEGLDERILNHADGVFTIGDYVLTGGELPAMVVIDTVSRLIPGVLGNGVSADTDSFMNGLLEYPQYSRPEVWRGKTVPAVLLSGDHAKVDRWRKEQSLQRTKERRPDLYEKYMREHPDAEKKRK